MCMLLLIAVIDFTAKWELEGWWEKVHRAFTQWPWWFHFCLTCRSEETFCFSSWSSYGTVGNFTSRSVVWTVLSSSPMTSKRQRSLWNMSWLNHQGSVRAFGKNVQLDSLKSWKLLFNRPQGYNIVAVFFWKICGTATPQQAKSCDNVEADFSESCDLF